MAPWIVIAVVGGALSATAGFFTRVVLKKTTHLESETKNLKAQVAGLMGTVPEDKPNKEM